MQWLGKRTREYAVLASVKRKAHDVLPHTFEQLDHLLPFLSDEWAAFLLEARQVWNGNLYSFCTELGKRIPNGYTFQTDPFIHYPGDFYSDQKETIEKWNSFSKELMNVFSVNFNPQINTCP